MTLQSVRWLVGAIAVVFLLSSDIAWAKQRAPRHSSQIFAAGEPARHGSKLTKVEIAIVEVDGKAIFAPNDLKFPRGATVRFQIRNDTSATHEFVIGSHTENIGHAETMKLSPVIEHDEPNARTLLPRATAVLDWHFSNSGTFEFACLLNGHAEVEEDGKIVVE